MRTASYLSGTPMRERLDPPQMTPPDVVDPGTPDVGPDGLRTNQAPMAPNTETRVEIANRATATYIPDASYANTDVQKGGAPGSPGSVITSTGIDGVTHTGAVPASPIKLSYGLADWISQAPTFVAAHLKINRNANPNRPQVNPTPFNIEGPQGNTQYTTPSPFAAGVFVG